MITMTSLFSLMGLFLLASATYADDLDFFADEPRITLATGESILAPQPRPDRRSLYTMTLPHFGDFYENETGLPPLTVPVTLSLQKNEGIAEMLIRRGGFTAAEAQNAVAIIAEHRSMRRLPVGFEITAITPLDDRPGALRVPLENYYDLSLYQDVHGKWQSLISARPITSILAYTHGVIDSSLYLASTQNGLDDATFYNFVQIFSFSVDFQREVRKGDSFEAFIETRIDELTGKPFNGATLHYLSLTLSGDRLEYYRHEHEDGTVAWYDADGNAATRTLMRTPVNGARLSSGFGKRKHPILGYSKLHRGVDFAAPTGTPIMAAGSGTIEYAGRNGGYGNYVRIRHNSTYKTAYAHMSKIKSGITKGARVKQGEIIGYIGSTGQSTGPHLHYEILVNNKKTNPMTVRLPAGTSIIDSERPLFENSITVIQAELQSRGITSFASNR